MSVRRQSGDMTTKHATRPDKQTRATVRRAAKESLRHTGVQRFRLLFMRDGKEIKGPWFNNLTSAHQAREMMVSKYGLAVIYID